MKESDFSDLEGEINDILIPIDEKTGEVSEIKNMEEEIADYSLNNALFYQDLFYYNHYEEDDDYDDDNQGIVGIYLNETEGEQHFLPSSRMRDEEKSDNPEELTFIDGKVYYEL